MTPTLPFSRHEAFTCQAGMNFSSLRGQVVETKLTDLQICHLFWLCYMTNWLTMKCMHETLQQLTIFLNVFCPPIQTCPPNIILRKNCPTKSNVEAFVWEMTYPLEISNSSGGGNILLIKIKIYCPTGQNLDNMTP